MNNIKPILLFDMDGTTYDFQTPLSKLIQKTTTLPLAFRKQMENTKNWTKIALWELFKGTEKEQNAIRDIIEPLYQSREFFSSLRPYPGIVELIHQLEKEYSIRFCTKPSKKDCDSEGAKREAIIRDFGHNYSKKIIMAHDKTMIRGDILIDDNPHIRGEYNPQWEHILVDQPHNQESLLPRLHLGNLKEWKKKIDLACARIYK